MIYSSGLKTLSMPYFLMLSRFGARRSRFARFSSSVNSRGGASKASLTFVHMFCQTFFDSLPMKGRLS